MCSYNLAKLVFEGFIAEVQISCFWGYLSNSFVEIPNVFSKWIANEIMKLYKDVGSIHDDNT